jgi:UV damage endonuclease UvdE
MFNQQVKRIGFACKIQSAHDVADPKLNTKTTTLTWLNKQTRDKAVEKLWLVQKHNVEALKQQLLWLTKQPNNQRQFRLSSDLCPAYTHEDWMWWYFEPDVQRFLAKHYGEIGDLARQHDIRLSFHPGQFCVLASENAGIVDNSILEFEYHCDLIRYMGFGRQFQDFKCNVHIGGKQGPMGIKRALKKLSQEARNCLTIENSEYTWGLDSSLELVSDCALVLDVHHHWINTGEYIKPTDPKVQQVLESWRGVRPTMHYSVSREDCLVDHCKHTKPDLIELKQQGFTSTKLRAHSDYMWNLACNEWIREHYEWADIMVESKQKNLAQQALAKQILT